MKEEIKDKVQETLVKEPALINFLEDRSVRIAPIIKRNPFPHFSIDELDPNTGKYESKKNIPEQFNNTFKYIGIPLDRKTGRIKKILDNTTKVYTVQYPYTMLTEQEFFETQLGLQKNDLDTIKTFTTDQGNVIYRSFWSTAPAHLKLDNSPTDLNLNIAGDMLKYKVALANTKTKIAPNMDSISSNPSFTHVITDVQTEQLKDAKIIENKSSAFAKLFEIVEGKDIKKLNELHSMLEGKWQNSTKYDGAYALVFNKVEKDPDKFLAVVNDPKYKTKLMLMKFIKYGEVRPFQGSYKTVDDREMGTYNEALVWLEESENFAVVEKIKNRLSKQL